LALVAGAHAGFVLSDFIETALAPANYEKLDDGSFAGHISSSPGVVAFAATLASCENDLRSTLEDWIVLGLKVGLTSPTPFSDCLARRHRPRRTSTVLPQRGRIRRQRGADPRTSLAARQSRSQRWPRWPGCWGRRSAATVGDS
jgi:predicted RNase H-like HicB family nuclease